MPSFQKTSSLTIHLIPEQLGFLAYLYPNEDPEEALIKLLDSARNRAIRIAEQPVNVAALESRLAQRLIDYLAGSTFAW